MPGTGKIGRPGKGEPPRRFYRYRGVPPTVLPRSQAADRRDIAYQNGPLRTLHPMEDLHHRFRQVKPVANNTRPKPILRQLRPEVVLKPGEHRVGAVSQVSGEGSTGLHRFGDPLRRGCGMANRRDHPIPADFFNKLQGPITFRGQGNDFYQSPRCLLPTKVLIVIRVPDAALIVGTPRSVLPGNVGALHVDSRNSPGQIWVLISGSANCLEIFQYPVLRRTNNGGTVPGDARIGQGRGNPAYMLPSQLSTVVAAEVAVHLNVGESGTEVEVGFFRSSFPRFRCGSSAFHSSFALLVHF